MKTKKKGSKEGTLLHINLSLFTREYMSRLARHMVVRVSCVTGISETAPFNSYLFLVSIIKNVQCMIIMGRGAGEGALATAFNVPDFLFFLFSLRC